MSRARIPHRGLGCGPPIGGPARRGLGVGQWWVWGPGRAQKNFLKNIRNLNHATNRTYIPLLLRMVNKLNTKGSLRPTGGRLVKWGQSRIGGSDQ